MIARRLRHPRRNQRAPAGRIALRAALFAGFLALLVGCDDKPTATARPPTEVTALTVAAQDTPIIFEFVAETQSSREVEIQARVEGFLDRRLYTEGELVKAGQVLFQMDRKPFEAALQSARGQLAQQQARWEVAKATLARVRPLAEKGAVSKKDLDDAIGQERATRAAVLSAEGAVRTAQLNLGYTTIKSPLTGLSSFAKKQDGSYLTPGPGGLLTTVAQMDPMYVNFSISENEILGYREQIAKGQLRFPGNQDFEVEVVLADGSRVPHHGRLNFADPSFSRETGTFLVRAVVANPDRQLRPGQFVRVQVKGATRPNAILVPQRAVLQGARSHYVWIIGKDGKAEQRVVDVGDWHGDDWFIPQGLQAGERLVVDGAIRVTPGAELKIVEAAPPQKPSEESTASRETALAKADKAGEDQSH